MPARRPGGKAARRKQRQRHVPRMPQPSSQPSAPAEEHLDVVEVAEPAETAAAPEAPRASASRPSADRGSRRRTSPPPVTIGTSGSSLTARERADYHYVERDLRNIGILTVVMAAMLLVAWVVFNALGLHG